MDSSCRFSVEKRVILLKQLLHISYERTRKNQFDAGIFKRVYDTLHERIHIA